MRRQRSGGSLADIWRPSVHRTAVVNGVFHPDIQAAWEAQDMKDRIAARKAREQAEQSSGECLVASVMGNESQ